MNNIIKISIVVTLALVIALFAGCGKKKTEKPKNESSILTGGDIEDILGKDDEVTSDIGMVELDPDADEDTVDVGVLDNLGSSSSNESSDNSSKDNSSKDNNSSKNQSSSSKNESSSKNQGSSSKNESSSKNQGSSSKNESSSKNQTSSQTSTNGMSSEMEKDNDSKVYTPGWI